MTYPSLVPFRLLRQRGESSADRAPAAPPPGQMPSVDGEALRARCEAAEAEAERLRAGLEQAESSVAALSASAAQQEQLLADALQRAERVEMEAMALAAERDQLWEQLQDAGADRGRTAAGVSGIADGLVNQVVTALAETEQAISAAIAAFTRIADEAREAAEIAATAMGRDTDVGVAHVAERATEVMGTFIEGMLVSARRVAASSRQLEGMTSLSASLSELLGEVADVADRTNLVALNATIEAAHAGDAGRAFGVVALEVRNLSDRSRQAARRMRELTGGTVATTESIYKDLAHTAERNLEASCLAQAEVNRLLQMLSDGGAMTRGALARLSTISGNIGLNYAEIVTAFQFHDLLRQRLEHVADPLCSLRDSLRDGKAIACDLPQGPEVSVADIASVGSVGAAPLEQPVSYAQQEDDNITLF